MLEEGGTSQRLMSGEGGHCHAFDAEVDEKAFKLMFLDMLI